MSVLAYLLALPQHLPQLLDRGPTAPFPQHLRIRCLLDRGSTAPFPQHLRIRCLPDRGPMKPARHQELNLSTE